MPSFSSSMVRSSSSTRRNYVDNRTPEQKEKDRKRFMIIAAIMIPIFLVVLIYMWRRLKKDAAPGAAEHLKVTAPYKLK